MNRRLNQKGFIGIIVLALSLAIVGILVFLNFKKIDDKVRGTSDSVNEGAQEKIENMKDQINEVQKKLNHANDKIKERIEGE